MSYEESECGINQFKLKDEHKGFNIKREKEKLTNKKNHLACQQKAAKHISFNSIFRANFSICKMINKFIPLTRKPFGGRDAFRAGATSVNHVKNSVKLAGNEARNRLI